MANSPSVAFANSGLVAQALERQVEVASRADEHRDAASFGRVLTDAPDVARSTAPALVADASHCDKPEHREDEPGDSDEKAPEAAAACGLVVATRAPVFAEVAGGRTGSCGRTSPSSGGAGAPSLGGQVESLTPESGLPKDVSTPGLTDRPIVKEPRRADGSSAIFFRSEVPADQRRVEGSFSVASRAIASPASGLPLKTEAPSSIGSAFNTATSVELMLGLAAPSREESRPTRSEAGTEPSILSAAVAAHSGRLGESIHEVVGDETTTQALRDKILSNELSINTRGWETNLSQRLTKMLETGTHEAVLRVAPEHLGSIEIRISLHEGQVSVRFGAAVADTRTALEQAIPRLRELLGQEGLALANAAVATSLGREARPVGLSPVAVLAATTSASIRNERSPESRAADLPSRPTRSRRGELDTYA